MLFPIKFLAPLVAFVSAVTAQSTIALANDDPSRQTECAALLEETDSLQQEAICTALKNVAPPEAAKYVDPKTGEFDYGAARAETDPATAREYRTAWAREYRTAWARAYNQAMSEVA